MKKALILLLCYITYSFGQSLSEKFDLAMNSYNSSQYVEANRLFDEFMKKHTDLDELYATAEYYSAMALLKTGNIDRSEEHTSELQSLTNLVCRLLLENKKRSDRHRPGTVWGLSVFCPDELRFSPALSHPAQGPV